ncbi:MAG: hypothetical protein IKL73_00125 [Lachnospiraceae bacterium]|nr:hypothetical protein [Lachnospira sp.]MBR6696655.1 hypothetical protein [Lachnospiraceae bacterium]
MIKKFKILAFKKYIAGMLLLVLFSVSFMIFTGFEILSFIPHIDMSTIAVSDIKDGMYLELEVNEIYANFAEVKDGRGCYCIIPYPKEGEESYLMAVYIPKEHYEHAKLHFRATSNKEVIETPIKLNGRMEEMDDSIKALYKESLEDLDYADSDKVLYYYYKTAYMSGWDYLALIVSIIVIIWIIGTTSYIFSGASQKRVTKQLKERGITSEDLTNDLDKGQAYGNILIGEKYIAFLIGSNFRMLAKEDIIDVHKEKIDRLIINTQRGKEYNIKIRSTMIDKVVNILKNA